MKIINLRNLFTTSLSDLPEEVVHCTNVIYSITNIITGDRYIGQTRNLVDRFLVGSWSHRSRFIDCCKEGYTTNYLYNALKFYKCRSFYVEILDTCDQMDLTTREIYWISYYHTYYKDPSYSGGYNMTPGGESVDQMNTPDAIRRRLETNRLNHDGSLAWNSSEVAKRNYEAVKTSNGGVHPMHTRESISKMVDTQMACYDGHLACNTRESKEKMVATNRVLHGNPAWMLDTEYSRKRRVLTRMINYRKTKLASNLPQDLKERYEQELLNLYQERLELDQTKSNDSTSTTIEN